MLINAKDLKNSLFASEWDAFNSLIPYFGQKIFRTSNWTARKTPAWFLTDEWKLDASGLYASGFGKSFSHVFLLRAVLRKYFFPGDDCGG